MNIRVPTTFFGSWDINVKLLLTRTGIKTGPAIDKSSTVTSRPRWLSAKGTSRVDIERFRSNFTVIFKCDLCQHINNKSNIKIRLRVKEN